MALLTIGLAFALAFALIVCLFLWEEVQQHKRHARDYSAFMRSHEQCELERVRAEWTQRAGK
jgi:hypothetical protein